MGNNITCVKCGSDKIIKGAKFTDFSHLNVKRNLTLEIVKSKTFLFKNTQSREVLVDICGNCGNLDLYVENFEALWEAYVQK